MVRLLFAGVGCWLWQYLKRIEILGYSVISVKVTVIAMISPPARKKQSHYAKLLHEEIAFPIDRDRLSVTSSR
jgi:hypothetical protein